VGWSGRGVEQTVNLTGTESGKEGLIIGGVGMGLRLRVRESLRDMRAMETTRMEGYMSFEREREFVWRYWDLLTLRELSSLKEFHRRDEITELNCIFYYFIYL
jgi:hypothetical protein